MANGKLLNSYRVTYERLPNSLWKTNGWFSSGYRMTNVKLLNSCRITYGKLPNCCRMTMSRILDMSFFQFFQFFSLSDDFFGQTFSKFFPSIFLIPPLSLTPAFFYFKLMFLYRFFPSFWSKRPR